MVEIQLDGKKVEVPEGSMVMHAAEKAGTMIPHFCYHKKLSIAANCRMCLVDVEKAPKPMPACATPVTQGMIVRTKSDKAIKAQQSVMEFLLINHPLDCPICDQGGECQLQDMAVGYGKGASRYEEEKRVVFHKEVGPLISMEEMSRCIQCTRCVRFGQEIAGQMELGMVNRGEHSEITTFVNGTVDSELSGNMIDICPVGALTSKPFRYSARTWELSRRKSVSPHDSTGANLIVQVKNHKVLRVVPLENEAVNECWIADRDRFSYEALNSDARLTQPMVKQGGQWKSVDWTVALEYVANGLKNNKSQHGAASIGALASATSTSEELFLLGQLVRGLGSQNIDHRLRQSDFRVDAGAVRWLGLPIAELSSVDRALVIGSFLRKDHPLFAQRLRQAARHGAQIMRIGAQAEDWALPVGAEIVAAPSQWLSVLIEVAAAVATAKGVTAPLAVQPGEQAQAIAEALLSGSKGAVLLGQAASAHPQAAELLSIANWIAAQTGASCGFLGDAGNQVGAQAVNAINNCRNIIPLDGRSDVDVADLGNREAGQRRRQTRQGNIDAHDACHPAGIDEADQGQHRGARQQILGRRQRGGLAGLLRQHRQALGGELDRGGQLAGAPDRIAAAVLVAGLQAGADRGIDQRTQRGLAGEDRRGAAARLGGDGRNRTAEGRSRAAAGTGAELGDVGQHLGHRGGGGRTGAVGGSAEGVEGGHVDASQAQTAQHRLELGVGQAADHLQRGEGRHHAAAGRRDELALGRLQRRQVIAGLGHRGDLRAAGAREGIDVGSHMIIGPYAAGHCTEQDRSCARC